LRLSCAAGSYFGHRIAGGDFNGDGYSDIVVGAPLYSADGNYWGGRVYVYFGGGYDDLLAGALHDEYMRGHVYIYYGGAKMDNVYDVHIEGRVGDFIGEAIDGVGDVNKDGYDDILIGASGEGEGPGKAYLVYGGDNIGLENAEVFVGDSTEYDFGRWVAGLGDISGDGYMDMGILASKYFKILSGKDFKLLIKRDVRREWWTSCRSVANLGDLNNDSYSDFLIGVSSDSGTGEVEIYLGRMDPDTVPDYFLHGGNPYRYFAISVDYLGDVNGDGYREIIIGEYEKTYIYSFGDFNYVKTGDFVSTFSNFTLLPSYPNPFNNRTVITYEIGREGCTVDLAIYDVFGGRVRRFFCGRRSPGVNDVIWDGRDDKGRIVSAGVYLCRFEVQFNGKKYTSIKKMLFLK